MIVIFLSKGIIIKYIIALIYLRVLKLFIEACLSDKMYKYMK